VRPFFTPTGIPPYPSLILLRSRAHHLPKTRSPEDKRFFHFLQAYQLAQLRPDLSKDPKTFGDYIRKFSKEKGVFTKDFAKELGVTEDTVTNWEKRGKRPARENMKIFHKQFYDVFPRNILSIHLLGSWK